MNAGIFSLIFNFCTYSDQNSDTYLGTYTDYCELVKWVRGVLKKRKNLPTSFMDTKQKEQNTISIKTSLIKYYNFQGGTSLHSEI